MAMETSAGERVVIGINGFGRIGRLTLRAALMNQSQCIVAAINDPFMTSDYMSYLFRHDSVHGTFAGDVKVEVDELGSTFLMVEGCHIRVFSSKEPAMIPWRECGVEVVAETSGAFTTTEKARRHIDGGARRVVLSAPAKDTVTPTFVMGVNETEYNPQEMHVISNASCTTNCLAPLVKVINDAIGIEEGMMTTVHAGK